MALASHMGEYFGKTLVLEKLGYENCQKMGVSCWNRVYEVTVFRLVFSQPFRVEGVGGLVRIEDHTSGCVAHMAVLAGKLWFLKKSRSNQLCMGEWVGCGCCLVRLNVGFRELSNTWKLLGLDSPCQPHG